MGQAGAGSKVCKVWQPCDSLTPCHTAAEAAKVSKAISKDSRLTPRIRASPFLPSALIEA